MGARSLGVLTLVAALLGIATNVRGEDDAHHAANARDSEKARARYEAGRRRHAAGDYRGAIEEFTAGYQLDPRPLFLLNIGQAHRQLLEYESARVAYRRYLDEAEPNDPFRAQAAELLAEIERMQREQAPTSVSTPVPVPTLVVTPPPVVIATPLAPRWRRHLAWAIPTGVVVLSAIGVGIYFGVRGSSTVGCGGASFGCIPVGR